jgi:hypothetical protein
LNRIGKIPIIGQEKQKETNTTEHIAKNNGYNMDDTMRTYNHSKEWKINKNKESTMEKRHRVKFSFF